MTTTQPPTVRTASARLAALVRWHADEPAIRQAQRELVVAQAAAMASKVTSMLTGAAS